MTIWTYVAGWTLVHFLWQGTVMALATALLLRLLRDNDARLRYGIACAALALMTAAPLVTALVLARAVPDTATPLTLSSGSGLLASAGDLVRVTRSGSAPGVTFRTGLTIEAALPLVVAAWLAGVLVLLLRLAGGGWRVQRLHRAALALPPSRWQATATRVAERLRLARDIRVVDAVAVDTPTVIGWLRPIVLLPIAALANLTAEQVEAILAHELAHIRRHDFLVNLLQTLAETTLFYHPAVWWVSGRIRDEREHCCDDIAVGVCGDPVHYAEALTELAAWSVAEGPLVMAATRRPLLARVQRILRLAPPTDAGTRIGVVAALVTGTLLAGGIALGAVAQTDFPYMDRGDIGQASPSRQVARLIMRRFTPPPPVHRDTYDPADAPAWGVVVEYPGGRTPFIGYTGRSIIRYAYELPDMPVLDGPAWLDSESFDLTAATGAVAPGEEELRYAIRTALEQRFHLVSHRDSRDFPGYALVLAGGGLGPNLHRADGSCFTADMLREAAQRQRPLPLGQRTPLCGVEPSAWGDVGRGVTTGEIARSLRGPWIDRTIVDRTGLSGRFDFTLNTGLKPLALLASSDPWLATAVRPLGVLPVQRAIEQQLGLKLEPATVPLDVLVVDHAERPDGQVVRFAAPAAAPVTAAAKVEADAAAAAREMAQQRELHRRLEEVRRNADAARAAAMAAARQAAPGEVSGTLLDQFDAVLPAVQLTLSAGDDRRQATTDRTGRFTFPEVPPGGYMLTATLAGFRTLTRGITVRAGETTDFSVTMVVGMVEETITVVNDGEPPKVVERPGRKPVPPASTVSGPGGVRIGGNIRPPTKRKHVSPIYPASGAEGVVILSTVIGTDGFVKNTTALSSLSDDLSRAAIDAVNQWEFDPTLLDGIPIDTLMQVTVSFRAR